MMKSYKYRIYPGKSEEGKLENTLSMCRHLYNWSLRERNNNYQLWKQAKTIEKSINVEVDKKVIFSSPMGQFFYKRGNEAISVKTLTRIEGILGIMFSSTWENVPRNINYNYQQDNLSSLKEERPWFKSVHSQVLQDVLGRVDEAYEGFYNEGKGYPKYKKKGQYSSITYPQNIKFPKEDEKTPGKYKINVSKIGETKIVYHRHMPKVATIKTLTIEKDGGKWFACFSCELKHTHIEPEQDLSKSIGIDMGLIDFYYGSDGSHVEVPKYLRKSEKKLQNLQRRFNNEEKRTKRWYKLLKSLQKVHYKVRSQREDFLHKEANRLLKDFDIIIYEDLNIQGLKRRPKPKQDEGGKYLPNGASAKSGLNKSISDVSWGKFFEILKYKALVRGRTLKAIDPKYTSQICSQCGSMVEKSLSMRTHICPVCGLIIPRDYNSALYIKRLGLESLSKVTQEAPAIS
ncbi:MAG TPA: transposase [Candidatus Eremiobacteraeota bacterium]|nr:MAG: putative transposase [bacterium ADurb.Bin363]HPZ08567.1 transposase [Candidatus Eremiobacteraeota bacterium]